MLPFRAPARRLALAMAAVAAIVGAVVVVPAVSSVFPVPSAAAAGTPNVQLTRTVSGSTLYGRDVAVRLMAQAPDETPNQDGFNLTFSDVLPPGASVTSTTVPVSQTIAQLDGSTLVIWSNVADLLDDASVTLDYTFDYPVLGDLDARDVGDTFSGTANAYVNTNPYTIPNPTAVPADGSVWEDLTGSATATSTTTLVPYLVEKSELSSPESELLRGVHSNKTVYEIRISNNTVAATSNVTAVDYLPAALEFLGCVADDNSAAVEYPGAPPLGASFPSFTSCDPGYTASTVSLDPDGSGAGNPMPNAVYTRVEWSLADLAPGDVTTLRYAAAIPLHANVLDPLVTDPVANLDNNTGAEADDEQSIVNYAAVTADYTGGNPTATTFVVDDTATVSAEDVRVVKSSDLDTINQGQNTTWTLDLATSEYVYSTGDIVVTDVIPDGLDWVNSSPLPTSAPTVNPDGTLTVVWTIASMLTQDTEQITYQTSTRADYRATGDPVSAEDRWTNVVDLVTSTDLRTGADGSGSRAVATVVDHSEAGQVAGPVTIDKLIAAPVGSDCTVVTTWLDSSASAFHPGDVVCFRLDVDFPDQLDTVGAQISDYLPAGFALIGEPYYNIPLHDLGDSFALDYTQDTSGRVLTWTKDAVDLGKYFSVILTTQVDTTQAVQTTDIAGNLLKVRYQNTDDDTFQLRDQADATLSAPLLGLTKTLVSPASGTVEAGQALQYEIVVANSGGQDATSTEVWDVLPTGWGCGDVTSTVPAFTSCAAGILKWTGLAVTANNSTTLTVNAVTPVVAAPGDSYTNRAGVRSYQGASNTGPQSYFPTNNIDPSVTPNTAAAGDTAVVNVAGGTVTKTATSLVESGNNSASQATIGEVVTFTVTATVPSGTTLYGSPALTDPVNARYLRVGTPSYTLDTDGAGGAAPGAAVNATVTGATISVALGPLGGGDATTYVNPAGSGADIFVLTYQARVLDVATNKRSIATAIPNVATLRWQNSVGTNRSATGSRSVTVVEPHLTLIKTSDHDGSGIAAAGDIVVYAITVGNSGTRSSMAHETVITDTVPAQLIPLKAGNVPANDGDTLIGGGVWDAGTRVITFPEIPTIARNATTVLSYSAQVTDPVVVSGPIVNNVRATTTSLTGPATGERSNASPDGLGGTNTGYVETDSHSLNAPSLTLAKAASPGLRTIGELVDYTLTVGVPAGVFASDVTILDTLPAGIRYHGTAITVTCDQGGGACSPPIGAQVIGTPTASDSVAGFFLGDFDTASASRTVTIQFQGIVTTSAALGTQTNSARVYSNDVDTISGTPTTPPPAGSFTRPGASATADVTVQRPQLNLDKSVNGVDATRAKPGEVLHYTVEITNTGTSAAYDLTINDTPDSDLTNYTPISMPGATGVDIDPSDGSLSWSVAGPLAAGATLTLAYDLTVPATFDESDEVVGAELVNIADAPSYFGVPLAQRTLPASSYAEYDDVDSDQVDVELDLASLGDRLWFDIDSDGVQDAGEPGLVGVDVTVRYAGADNTFGNADDEVVTDTTDASGDYLAEDLPGGQYRVTVDQTDLPPGFGPSYDLDGIASANLWEGTLAQNGTPRNIDFGYTGTGSIGDLVWYDQDTDGVKDPAEPGIAGRTVTVVWAGLDGNPATTADNLTYQATTSASGTYSVGNLPAGSYTVTVSGMPVGYNATFDLDGTADGTATATLSAGQDRTDLDFGYAGTGSIGDLVWLDRDADGTFDPAGPTPEQGVAGATVLLDWHGVTGTATDPVVATFTVTTGTTGDYLFANLVPGSYTVRVTGGLPVAATNTHDRDSEPGNSQTSLVLANGDDVLDADFGYDSESMLGERVWWDRDGDGVQDSGEPGFAGVHITALWFGPNGLEGDGDDRTFTTDTVANGAWSITDLPEGNYRVSARTSDLPTGLSQTFDADGTGSANTSVVALGAGAVLTQNFGYRGPLTLGDVVFLDRNADGVQDADEPGLSGVTVQLDWNGFSVTTVTDSSGNYSLEGLAADDYTVAVLTATLPSASLTAVSDLEGAESDSTADLTLGASRTDADFGFRGDASIGNIVWHDRDADGVFDVVESGIAGVTVTATWAGRDGVAGTADDLAITETTGAGGAYVFDHLPAGDWVVQVATATLPAGFIDPTYEEDATLDASVAVTLAVSSVHPTADFGYRGSGSIGNRVWLDVNGDGVQDVGEPGIVGQSVELEWAGRDGTFDGIGDEVWNMTTASDGTWQVSELPDGVFRVNIVGGITALATQTGDPDATLDNTTDTNLSVADRLVDDADFGYLGAYSIGDTVWWDDNTDGVIDSTEPRLAGVTVEARWFGLDGTSGTADDIVRTTSTDSAGSYLFDSLAEGTYRVTVISGVPAGLDPVADPDALGATADGANTLDLPGALVGTADLGQDFGFAGSGAIGDRVWLDLDADGLEDAGEPGIPVVTATLTWAGTNATFGDADDRVWTDTTDSAGAYRFDGLPAGQFRIDLSGLPTDRLPTADPDGGTADTATVALAAGEVQLTDDFGYVGDPTIGDTVFIDFDGDDVQGPLEPGLSGVVLTVRHSGADLTLNTPDDLVLTTTTDATGNYLVSGLPDGPVQVTYSPASLPAGYVPSSDLDGGSASDTVVTLNPGDTRLDLDFAIVGDAQLQGIVFDDRNGNGVREAGEPGVPNIDLTVEWTGLAGNVALLVTTDATGAWALAAIPPGTYVTEIDGSTVPAGYRIDTQRTVTVILPAGGSGFVVMGITNAALALTGYDPRTNVAFGLLLLLIGIGALAIATRVSRRRSSSNPRT